ncbi:unnamed protein product [Lepeophtheirus salmonis]|uniref:(salmon louse) hypothetical protein n=1 Tax=Lepeophtheirus salmonis TaxID=72036 RepID=A0A7R8CX47_LEPSM|nr:zinc transporter 7-B-like [Lepeophtheirus salmonis]CAB4063709.1 unnamed protein product [Lepeophtheirus salmonis]CAF2928115.1 unnamed protein product [Lepeophtheirus salmonis]
MASIVSHPLIFSILLFVVLVAVQEASADSYGHGGHGHGHQKGHGTACIVKGSYCNCHYCKCEKGHVHCGGYGKGYGKKYCYGSTQGEYCHCDYCKCKHGFGSTGYGGCH